MLENILKRFLLFLLFSILMIYPDSLGAQDYTVDNAVCHTICSNQRYWADDDWGYLKFRLDSSLNNYVTGLKFEVEITDIQGFVYSNISDTIKVGDLFQLPTSAEDGILQIAFTKYGDYFDFIIKIVGTPQIAGENYYSDIVVAMTLALARNILTIFPKSDSTKIVQSPTIVNTRTKQLLNNFDILNNYPNPFNSSTTISYTISKPAFVTLKIYNSLGHELIRLVDTFQQEGKYLQNYNSKNLPSGIYFYSLFLNSKSIKTNKMQVIK